jgi:NADPH:quinone reductase
MVDPAMNAMVSLVPGHGEGLQYRRIPAPLPGFGEVRVQVRACGLAFPDLLMLDDRYQAKAERPFVPGMEVAGIVDRVGDGVTDIRVGDRLFGHGPSGGLAELAVLSAANATVIPEAIPFDHAAGLTSTYVTAYHALRQRGALRAGETLLVLGAAGGVGIAAIQIGKALGARVIAAASSQAKVDVAIGQGADAGIVYPAELGDGDARAFTDRIKAEAGGGVDVICDIVGGAYSEPAFRAIAWDGRFLVIGFPAGIARLPLNLPLLKGAQVVGVYCGAFLERQPEAAAANMAELIALHQAGAIRPFISASFPLHRSREAFAMLAARQALGKVVVTMGGEADQS